MGFFTCFGNISSTRQQNRIIRLKKGDRMNVNFDIANPVLTNARVLDIGTAPGALLGQVTGLLHQKCETTMAVLHLDISCGLTPYEGTIPHAVY